MQALIAIGIWLSATIILDDFSPVAKYDITYTYEDLDNFTENIKSFKENITFFCKLVARSIKQYKGFRTKKIQCVSSK